MATTAKKVTQLGADGTPIETFDSIAQAVDKLKIKREDLKLACEMGTPIPTPMGEFTFRFETSDSESVDSKSSDSNEKLITLTEARLAELLEGVEKRIEKKYDSLIKGAPVQGNDMRELATIIGDAMNQDSIKRYRSVDAAAIDPDDFLQEPRMFYCRLNYYAIHGEKRMGHEVNTPYRRPLVFQNISGHVTGAGIGKKQTVQISACQITTKKELEWILKSPKLGIIIFENVEDGSDVDNALALELASAVTEVAALTDHQMIQRALNEGIPQSKDVDMMRSRLIRKMAEKAIKFSRSVSAEAASSLGATIDDTLKRKSHSGVTVTSY